MTDQTTRPLAGRSAAELTSEELQQIATEAFSQAALEAAAQGLPVPGYVGGQLAYGLEDEAYLAALRKRAATPVAGEAANEAAPPPGRAAAE